MIARFALLLLVTLSLVACENTITRGDEPAKPAPRTITLNQGTEVPLLLLSALSSGGSKEGDSVVFVVSDDVEIDGSTAIPKGTIALAEISWSRGASVASQMVNQPARLAISMPFLSISPDQRVKLTYDGKESFEFNQENTQPDQSASELQKAAQDEELRAALLRVVEGVSLGGDGAGISGDAGEQDLRKLADALDLPATRELVEAEGGIAAADQLGDLVNLAKGGNLSALQDPQLLLALSALEELGSLAGRVDKGLRGAIKGSNIHARVGTKLVFEVAETVQVTVVGA